MIQKELQLKKNREFSLIKGHPWVYPEAIKELPSYITTGDFIDLFSHKRQWLGKGYIDTESKILVRLLPLNQNESPHNGLARLVKRAISLRKQFFNDMQTDSYRLINGEGDFLPGLIVDRYADALSLQIYSLGLLPWLKYIINEITRQLTNIRWIWQRNHVRLAKQDSSRLIYGKDLPPKIIFHENSLKYITDLINGQKTGFFLDQRDNRQLIRNLAKGKKFLNVCGYTGAFTVAAAAGGATESITVDIARPALIEAEANLKLNGFSTKNHRLVCADMYEYLKNEKQNYDLVVLDPPSMAKSRKNLQKTIRAYEKLNLAVIKVVKPGGMLFTASCTSQISREEFIGAVRQAIAQSKRQAQIICESYHPVDHPIAIAHPEGRYLKGLLLRLL